MSPDLLEPDLREWDVTAVPTEILVSALDHRTGDIRDLAGISCAVAIVESLAPPEYRDLPATLESMRDPLRIPRTVRVDVRVDGWWPDVATLLVLGVPVSIEVGPVPRKRHGWPGDHRDALRARAKEIVRGWGDAGVVVRESRDEPGQWSAPEMPDEVYTSERSLTRTDDGFAMSWHMPGLPRTGERVRLGRWREYAIWHIGTSVCAVRLPPVLARCSPTGLELSPDRWVTHWSPDASVWPDV